MKCWQDFLVFFDTTLTYRVLFPSHLKNMFYHNSTWILQYSVKTSRNYRSVCFQLPWPLFGWPWICELCEGSHISSSSTVWPSLKPMAKGRAFKYQMSKVENQSKAPCKCKNKSVQVLIRFLLGVWLMLRYDILKFLHN